MWFILYNKERQSETAVTVQRIAEKGQNMTPVRKKKTKGEVVSPRFSKYDRAKCDVKRRVCDATSPLRFIILSIADMI